MNGVVLLAMSLLFGAPPVEDVRRAADDVLRDSEIQSRYPVRAKGPLPRTKEDDSMRLPGFSAAQVLMWVLIVAGVALGLFFLASKLGGYTADLPAEVTGGPGAAAMPRAPPPATEAERLADEGRFEEAIHMLLLLALHPLTEEEHLAGSLTSREILRTVELPAPAREAMSALVRAVEISVFGGLAPDRADYDRCAGEYHRYAEALGLEAA